MCQLNRRLLMSLLLLGSLAGSTRPFLTGEEKPNVKKEPARYTSPGAGAEMYKQYCASCHGLTGKGDGPAAPALKSQPADLTTMARRNNGVFPKAQVRAILDGKGSPAAHGSSDMPVWGPIFHGLGRDTVMLRITNLTKQVESMQVK